MPVQRYIFLNLYFWFDMKREICAPEVPASQMVLTIITDEQLEAFADAVITKYQQTIVRHKAAEKPQEEWMTRKEVMTLLRRCDSTMTKWARRGYLVPSMVGSKHLYRTADVMRILNGGRKQPWDRLTAPAFPCPEEPSPAWTATVSGCGEMPGRTIHHTALCWTHFWIRCWRPMKKPPPS